MTVTTNGTLITKKRAEAIARIASDRLHFNISPTAMPTAMIWCGPGACGGAHQGCDGSGRRCGGRECAPEDLANTLLHARNVDHFMDVLDEQALGFDGVRVLNLFRQEDDVPPEAANLWFHDHHQAALASVAEAWRIGPRPRPPPGADPESPAELGGSPGTTRRP